MDFHNQNTAYIVGIALGDGNLSSPNGRATRLRVTCDSLYPNMAAEIMSSLKIVFPSNKVSIVDGPRNTYFNISVYSNKLNDLMPWKVGKGSKYDQEANVPDWINGDEVYIKACLRGLIQTDGSIYKDRGYTMVNFTNNIESLATNVFNMIESLGYKPHLYTTNQRSGNPKYTVRLSKDADLFIKELGLYKN